MANPSKNSDDLILVCGCPRSGTSFVASEMRSLGLQTVSSDRESDTDYRDGVVEDIRLDFFLSSIERYMMAVKRGKGMKAFDIEPLISTNDLNNDAVSDIFKSTLKKSLDGKPDFLKLPQILLCIDFFYLLHSRVQFIIVWRGHAANIKSLSKREFSIWNIPFRMIRSHLLWIKYANLAVEAKRKYPDRCFFLDVQSLNKRKDLIDNLRMHSINRALNVDETQELDPPRKGGGLDSLQAAVVTVISYPFLFVLAKKRNIKYISVKKLTAILKEQL